MRRLQNEPNAFIGHRSKLDSTWCRYDGQTLACGVSLKYRLFLMLVGAVFGPGMTIAWLCSQHSLHQIPPFALVVVLFMGGVAWLLFIRMLVYRRTIRFEFALGDVVFESCDLLGSKRNKISMKQVIGLEASVITRLRDESTPGKANEIACYYVTMHMADGKQVRLFETTKTKRIREFFAAIARHLGDQWIITDEERLN